MCVAAAEREREREKPENMMIDDIFSCFFLLRLIPIFSGNIS